MSNRTYDILKYINQIVIPAFSTLYITISSIWGWPHVKAIAGTIAAANYFLGRLLKRSSSKYYRGKHEK